MTTSADLLDLVHAAIMFAGTDADTRVFKPGDWPTQSDQYPIVKLRLVAENRTSLGRSGPPEFTTVAIVRVQGEVSEPARLDDLGATAAETALWALKRQIEVAVINSYPLTAAIQQFASITSQLAFSSEAATHLAGMQMDLALEFYEGPESFAPIEADDLHDARVDFTTYPPAGVDIPLT